MSIKCTGILIEEHKTILRTLDVLNAMAHGVAAGQPLVREDIEDVLDILRSYADDLHQGKEEDVLFPVVTKACDKAKVASFQHMAFEHNQERALIESMADALSSSQGENFVRHAKHYVAIVRNHIYKEDNIVFEMVDDILSPEEDDRIVAAYDTYEHAIDDKDLDKLMQRLRSLEWKYLGKAA